MLITAKEKIILLRRNGHKAALADTSNNIHHSQTIAMGTKGVIFFKKLSL